jgi:DNA-binding transcriptional ArsR family regulator
MERSMERVFKALASSPRRRILDLLKASSGTNVGDLATRFRMSRIAVMKHLAVLERADLVLSLRRGRQRLLYLNAVPLQMIHDRWLSDFSAHWAQGLTQLKYEIERNNRDPKLPRRRVLRSHQGRKASGMGRSHPPRRRAALLLR